MRLPPFFSCAPSGVVTFSLLCALVARLLHTKKKKRMNKPVTKSTRDADEKSAKGALSADFGFFDR